MSPSVSRIEGYRSEVPVERRIEHRELEVVEAATAAIGALVRQSSSDGADGSRAGERRSDRSYSTVSYEARATCSSANRWAIVLSARCKTSLQVDLVTPSSDATSVSVASRGTS